MSKGLGKVQRAVIKVLEENESKEYPFEVLPLQHVLMMIYIPKGKEEEFLDLLKKEKKMKALLCLINPLDGAYQVTKANMPV